VNLAYSMKSATEIRVFGARASASFGGGSVGPYFIRQFCPLSDVSDAR
jgi:hypothetical protein